MCAFKFRLESVVGVKKRKEDERKVALACAKKDLQQKEATLVNLYGRRKNYQKCVGDKVQGGDLDISGMLIYYAYLEKLTDEIANHTGAVEKCKEEVESKRELLLESSKEKKALEKLKERMKTRYVAKIKKAEQADLDETAAKYHKRRPDNGLHWKRG